MTNIRTMTLEKIRSTCLVFFFPQSDLLVLVFVSPHLCSEDERTVLVQFTVTKLEIHVVLIFISDRELR